MYSEKIYPSKWIAYSTVLPDPGVTAIGRSQNHGVRILVAHSRSCVRVGKRHSIQKIEGDSWLTVPLLSAIGRLKKYACVTNNRAGIRIGEGHGIESVGSLRQRIVRLFNPVVSSVCCSENDTGAAQLEAANCSVVGVGERNAI